MMVPDIPRGFRRVTLAEFFAALSADTRDIMPSHRRPDCVTWETAARVVFGWSSPGWQHPGDEKIYALRESEVQ